MPEQGRVQLVPRFEDHYAETALESRREWVENKLGLKLPKIGQRSIAGPEMVGNIENPIGTVQMPLGIAGPIRLNGQHAKGDFYIPLATTEGALVRSYERGMVALTRSGGVEVAVHRDENRMGPIFFFDSTAEALGFCQKVVPQLAALQQEVAKTTQHGRLLAIEPFPAGRHVILNFRYTTGDAQGMNMIAKATQACCEWLKAHFSLKHYLIFSGMSSEKRASGFLLGGGKGKTVTAGALIPAKIIRTYLHTTPQALHDLWQYTMVGHVRAGSLGYNGHLANGLTAIFIATGQDVANVANASVGVTHFEVTASGDLYASLTLPALTIGTVGGGTQLGTSRECLDILGCLGSGKAVKLAEIIAASLLAGELSFAAAIASGEFVAAHELYGRNRPEMDL